jgi:hypothetical protein
MLKTFHLLILIGFAVATSGYGSDDNVFLDLNHYGHPSQRAKDAYGKPFGNDDCDISIAKEPFPKDARNIVTNPAGYSFLANFTGNNHAIYSTIFVNTPSGHSSKITVGQYYWADGNLSLRWVSENLLFMRIWWGRHWGDDYIYNADTQKIIYSDGFSERREAPIKKE